MLSFLVSHISDINCPEFGYKTGVKDHVGYFPIHAMSQELGEKMPRAVLAFHAITGWNTLAAPLPELVTRKDGRCCQEANSIKIV